MLGGQRQVVGDVSEVRDRPGRSILGCKTDGCAAKGSFVHCVLMDSERAIDWVKSLRCCRAYKVPRKTEVGPDCKGNWPAQPQIVAFKSPPENWETPVFQWRKERCSSRWRSGAPKGSNVHLASAASMLSGKADKHRHQSTREAPMRPTDTERVGPTRRKQSSSAPAIVSRHQVDAVRCVQLTTSLELPP
jgi:hypothetical protein